MVMHGSLSGSPVIMLRRSLINQKRLLGLKISVVAIQSVMVRNSITNCVELLMTESVKLPLDLIFATKRGMSMGNCFAKFENVNVYNLIDLYPDNKVIEQKFLDCRKTVDCSNHRLKGEYELERIENAAGDARKTMS